MTVPHEHSVRLTEGRITLEGILGLPDDPDGVVVFAYGSSTGRLSPRNNFVTHQLQQVCRRSGNNGA